MREHMSIHTGVLLKINSRMCFVFWRQCDSFLETWHTYLQRALHNGLEGRGDLLGHLEIASCVLVWRVHVCFCVCACEYVRVCRMVSHVQYECVRVCGWLKWATLRARLHLCAILNIKTQES